MTSTGANVRECKETEHTEHSTVCKVCPPLQEQVYWHHVERRFAKREISITKTHCTKIFDFLTRACSSYRNSSIELRIRAA